VAEVSAAIVEAFYGHYYAIFRNSVLWPSSREPARPVTTQTGPHMKKILFATVSLAAISLATSAMSADLAARLCRSLLENDRWCDRLSISRLAWS
jgi:hypothetical protein